MEAMLGSVPRGTRSLDAGMQDGRRGRTCDKGSGR